MMCGCFAAGGTHALQKTDCIRRKYHKIWKQLNKVLRNHKGNQGLGAIDCSDWMMTLKIQNNLQSGNNVNILTAAIMKPAMEPTNLTW